MKYIVNLPETPVLHRASNKVAWTCRHASVWVCVYLCPQTPGNHGQRPGTHKMDATSRNCSAQVETPI